MELERNRKKKIREAQEEARKIISEANKKVEHTIKEIKEREAEKNITRKLRQELEASKPELIEIPVVENEPSVPKEKGKKEMVISQDQKDGSRRLGKTKGCQYSWNNSRYSRA